jgi:hypothetical protein
MGHFTPPNGGISGTSSMHTITMEETNSVGLAFYFFGVVKPLFVECAKFRYVKPKYWLISRTKEIKENFEVILVQLCIESKKIL